MLLIYVALIGSAGWLLFTTPQGFIPAQDRGYVIVSVQLPGRGVAGAYHRRSQGD